MAESATSDARASATHKAKDAGGQQCGGCGFRGNARNAEDQELVVVEAVERGRPRKPAWVPAGIVPDPVG
jgi:hypothetical protein